MTDTIRNERLIALAEFFEAGAPHFEFRISTGFAYKGGSLDEAIDGKCQTAGCIAGFAFMQAMRKKTQKNAPSPETRTSSERVNFKRTGILSAFTRHTTSV